MITAERVYKEILEMPAKERERLFAVIARKGFENDHYTHQEVFSDIRRSPFTIKEASERRWGKDGILKSRRIGKNVVFDVDELKIFKKQRHGK